MCVCVCVSVCARVRARVCASVFSPEFIGRRALIISHDHTHHLNVVIVSTKHLLHVYHCQQSILVQFNVH